MVGRGHHNMRYVVKGRSIRKVKNHTALSAVGVGRRPKKLWHLVEDPQRPTVEDNGLCSFRGWEDRSQAAFGLMRKAKQEFRMQSICICIQRVYKDSQLHSDLQPLKCLVGQSGTRHVESKKETTSVKIQPGDTETSKGFRGSRTVILSKKVKSRCKANLILDWKHSQ